jgi:subtilisin family serine protease
VTTSLRWRLTAFAAVVLALLAGAVPAGALGADEHRADPPAGEPLTVAAIVEGPDGPAVEQHEAPTPEAAERLVAALQARDDVMTAEVDVVMRALQEPTGGDPLRDLQWALDRLRVETAWTVGDARGRVVAVVDSGVDAAHPDLQGVVLNGFDALDPRTLGKVDPLTPCPGRSWDCRGHGTHVAGIIAALVGNDEGVAGLARGAQILPVRVLDAAGYGSSSDVARGVLFAAGAGAHVINLSLGSTEPSSVLDFAVAYATRRGALVVSASGNVGHYIPHPVVHPAADPWTLAVGATDRDDRVVAFSGRGPWLDLVAPGVDIWSARPISGSVAYDSDSGTSMATPYVSAVAAVVQRRHPTLSPMRLAAHLRATATDLPPAGRDPASGDGLVNLVGALSRTPGAATACDPRRVPRSEFADTARSTHRAAIECAVWYAVAQGTTGSTYSPAGPVTRAQMASFIARLLDRSGTQLPAGGAQRFSDVPAGNVHREAINRLAAAGIVQGQGTTFSPNGLVTRDQMASFLVRAFDYAQAQVRRAALPPAGRQFADTAGNPHEPNINKAAAAGLANGLTTTTYGPRQGVRRDQMATFVIRALELLAA